MNWSHKITAAYLIFVAGIVFLVVKASNQQVDLVTKDYYGKEMEYQQRIDEITRAKALTEQPSYSLTPDMIEIRLPGEFSQQQVKVIAVLYCPADATRDRSVDISQPGNIVVKIPVKKNDRGNYTIQLNIECQGKRYYFEHNLFI